MGTEWLKGFEPGRQVGCNPRFHMFIVFEITDTFLKLLIFIV